jgi:hypothetical protein
VFSRFHDRFGQVPKWWMLKSRCENTWQTRVARDMREIDPGDIHSRANHFLQHLFRFGGGAEGVEDTRSFAMFI